MKINIHILRYALIGLGYTPLWCVPQPNSKGAPCYMKYPYENKSLTPLTKRFEDAMYVEEWRPILNYEDIYEISSFGRLKSLARTFKTGVGHTGSRTVSTRLKSLCLNSDGYVKCSISKNGVNKTKSIHILVFDTFNIRDESKPEVNHKNGVRCDNFYLNLEGADDSDQQTHSYSVLGRKGAWTGISGKDHPRHGLTGKQNAKSKPVLCVTTGKTFESAKLAAKSMSLDFSDICKVCRGKRKASQGFVFKYV